MVAAHRGSPAVDGLANICKNSNAQVQRPWLPRTLKGNKKANFVSITPLFDILNAKSCFVKLEIEKTGFGV